MCKKGIISHFSLFQEGRAKEEESQGGSSVQRGKGWHEGPKSLGGSNSLQHNAQLGCGAQSGYSRNQPHRAVERQSPLDKKSLKKKNIKLKLKKYINFRETIREKINQGYYCSCVHCFPHPQLDKSTFSDSVLSIPVQSVYQFSSGSSDFNFSGSFEGCNGQFGGLISAVRPML